MNKNKLGVVVEGRKDRDLLLQVYPHADVVYLGGTRFNRSAMAKVQNLVEVSECVISPL